MGFLSPLFLALGLGAAVPLLIHLLRRRTGLRSPVSRCAVSRARGAGAQPAAQAAQPAAHADPRARDCLHRARRGEAVSRALGPVVGAGHAPAAIAVVLDNSLSTSVIVDGQPVLTRLKTVARSVTSRGQWQRPRVARDGGWTRPGRRTRHDCPQCDRCHRSRWRVRATCHVPWPARPRLRGRRASRIRSSPS